MEQFTKDENGDCKIGVLKQVTETEVSTKIIERAVEIQLGKIPTRMAAVIAVVGNDDTALGKPQPPLVHEGFFEWTMLGYRAKRAIQFFDEDVRDFQ